MISWVAVSQTEVQFAGITDQRHQLLLLALALVTLVREHLLFRLDLTIVFNVF